MNTSNFISCALGCGTTGRAIDNFCENFNISYTFDDIYDAIYLCAENPQDFNNIFLEQLWLRVQSSYIDKGLNPESFDCYLNGEASHFCYNGEEVYDSEDLDNIVLTKQDAATL